MHGPASSNTAEHDAAAPTGWAAVTTTLVLLTLANTFNLADRMLLGVLQESLRREFNLSDFQLGLLGGTSFAVLYAVLTIPIARIADRRNRVTIISLAVGVWSGMTILCGLCTSYVQLLIARAGVSVGEAGCVAPSLSFISDRFSARRRATAMAVFAIGGPAGAMLATTLGAWTTQHYGWRGTFIGFGMAGCILAALIRLCLRERRKDTGIAHQTRFFEGLGILFSSATYRYVCLAGIFAAFSGTFIMQYMTSFLMRMHGLPLPTAALVTGLAGGLCGMISAFGAGMLADKVRPTRPGAQTMMLAGAFTVAAIALSAAWWSPLAVAIPLLMIGTLGMNAYPGVSFAVSSMTAPAHLRATAIGIFTLTGNLLGYAFGPPILGWISDVARGRLMAEQGLRPGRCFAEPTLSGCLEAQGGGLQIALTLGSLLLFGAAACHWRATRTLASDVQRHVTQS